MRVVVRDYPFGKLKEVQVLDGYSCILYDRTSSLSFLHELLSSRTVESRVSGLTLVL